MKRSRVTGQQIAFALHEAEARTAVDEEGQKMAEPQLLDELRAVI